MTKQAPTNSQAARPASGAGAPAITPDMIDAGLYQFLREYPETGTGDELDRRMVARIYEAMLEASVPPQKAALDEPV